MSKTAVIDIDNTLWQFSDALYIELQKVNEGFPLPVNWTHWDLWEGYCSREDFFAAINRIHLNQDSDSYIPYPEAKAFLKTLRENGFRITIASHRSPKYRKQTEKWLLRHQLQYDSLHLSFNKSVLFDRHTHVVVDDSPKVLEKALASGAVGTGLLFPWNREYRSNGFQLFDNLSKVLDYILER